jgi:hypothetical protein
MALIGSMDRVLNRPPGAMVRFFPDAPPSEPADRRGTRLSAFAKNRADLKKKSATLFTKSYHVLPGWQEKTK